LKISYKRLVVLLGFLIAFSCGEKEDKQETDNKGGEFQWTENISIDHIPEKPLTAMMNGKELKINYINFEQWRGSGDNVINFSSNFPKQNCGYVENDDAFHIMHISGEFEEGDFVKSSFDTNIDGIVADFHYYDKNNNIKKVSTPWNCAMVITEIGDKIVKGKIALCFKDKTKSWVAGTFEAIRCYN
jgi:hypothetical protein